MTKLRKAHTGLLGPYHYKSLYDYLVATSFLPPRYVWKYPVCPDGGTTRRLCEVYAISGHQTGPQTYGRMLAELTCHVKSKSSTWWRSDHMGASELLCAGTPHAHAQYLHTA